LGVPNRELIVLEVKMEDLESANKVRKTFVEMKKKGKPLDTVNITNSVNLATRVRIEVLKAITKKFDSDSEKLWLSQYVVRPFIRSTNMATKQEKIFTYSDAVERYGLRMNREELNYAYQRVGMAFRGQLAQHFVILHDPQREAYAKTSSTRANTAGGSGQG
jgi:hypothetical protein